MLSTRNACSGLCLVTHADTGLENQCNAARGKAKSDFPDHVGDVWDMMENTKARNEISASFRKLKIAGRTRLAICDGHAVDAIDLKRVARIE